MPQTAEVTRGLDLASLKSMAAVDGPCVTITVPLESAPNQSRFELTRLKVATRQAEQQLAAAFGLGEAEVRTIFEPVRNLDQDAMKLEEYGGSLVIFRSLDSVRIYQSRTRFDESVVVGSHFHVFPLIHELQVAEQVFYILALSQKHVRLLRCTPTTSEEIQLPAGTPTSLEQWLNTRAPNSAPEHGAVRQSDEGLTGGSFTSTHDRDNKDEHIANFFRVINKSVFDLLRGQKHPLVLCGVEYELAMYRQINTYPQLHEGGVAGSPESLKGGEMHSRALETVQEFFAGPAKKALASWDDIGGTERVATGLDQVVKAAFEARVAALFAAENARVMGYFDRNALRVTKGEPQDDLINAAALQTLAFGGDVFILNPAHVPGGGQVAAILRF